MQKNIKPLRLAELTFREIAAELKRCQGLILPLGGIEPLGEAGISGASAFCSKNIADALSDRCGVMVAPALEYGCSTAYKAFEGSAGLRSRTLSNILLELCGDWIFQGFKRIMLIDFSAYNSEACEIFLKRINAGKHVAQVFSVHSDRRIRSYITELMPGDEYGRSEFALLSLLAFLLPGFVSESERLKQKLPEMQVYRSWQKRGRDPQKFRKLFPMGSASQTAFKFDADLGKEIFGYILTVLEKDLKLFLDD